MAELTTPNPIAAWKLDPRYVSEKGEIKAWAGAVEVSLSNIVPPCAANLSVEIKHSKSSVPSGIYEVTWIKGSYVIVGRAQKGVILKVAPGDRFLGFTRPSAANPTVSASPGSNASAARPIVIASSSGKAPVSRTITSASSSGKASVSRTITSASSSGKASAANPTTSATPNLKPYKVKWFDINAGKYIDVNFAAMGVQLVRFTVDQERWLAAAEKHFINMTDSKGKRIGGDPKFINQATLRAAWAAVECVNQMNLTLCKDGNKPLEKRRIAPSIDPKSFLVQIFRETGYNPNLTGRDGEKGVGQIMEMHALSNSFYKFDWAKLSAGTSEVCYQLIASAVFRRQSGSDEAYNGSKPYAERIKSIVDAVNQIAASSAGNASMKVSTKPAPKPIRS